MHTSVVLFILINAHLSSSSTVHSATVQCRGSGRCRKGGAPPPRREGGMASQGHQLNWGRNGEAWGGEEGQMGREGGTSLDQVG